MSGLCRSAASLRFFGETLDPGEVTALLGGAPTHFYKKGDARRPKSGDTAHERRGHWRRVVERREPADLDGQIEELLAGLTTDMVVWKRLSDRFDADVFCGLFLEESNEGVEISPQTLSALGSRGLKLDLDIYGADVDEEPSPETISKE